MSLHNARNQSAMDQYFNEFVPMLEEAIRDELVDDDDPTIDLDCLQVARQVVTQRPKQPSHQQHRQQQQQQQQRQPPPPPQQQKPQQPKPVRKSGSNRTFEMAAKDGSSCSLDGLHDITEHLRRGSLYGDKLIRIMLDGLEKSVSPEFFAVIVKQGVPPTWLPIVKRNNEDTPYIEFLIKNDKSDEEPFSQISDYSLEHLALSKLVLDKMLLSIRDSNQQNIWRPPSANRTIVSASQHAASKQQLQSQTQQQQQRQQQHLKQHQQQNQQQQNLEQLNQQAKKRPLVSDKSKRSSLPLMTSTPIRQRQAAVAKRASAIPVSRPPEVDSLNDSKRVLPPRACKESVDGTYSKYLS